MTNTFARLLYLNLFGLLIVLVTACQGKKQVTTITTPTSTNTIKENIIGSWESTSVKILINTHLGSDSSLVMHIKEDEWEEKLNIKPIETIYAADNNYTSISRLLNDSIVSTSKGLWNVFGDTLYIIQPDVTYQYQVAFDGDLGVFRTLLDWDGDGEADDEYEGVQRRIKQR